MQNITKWALLLVLMYFPLFLGLDVLPLRLWDEARLAESAYEMNKYGSYLIPHILGNPDMWSVKPPLMIWVQVLFIKMIGVGELALRLPSAIAALSTCFLILAFCIKYLKNFWWGFAAVMVLLTSHGYMWMHAARSANYDSLLTLFTTLYCFAFYAYCVSGKTKYITVTFVGITLACLTKGVAGLLFLPGIFVFAIINKSVGSVLKSKAFYINLLIFLIVFPGYYLLREHYNPGYISKVMLDEWGGRYFEVIGYHSAGFFYYCSNLFCYQFGYWFLLAPIGIFVGLTSKNNRIKTTTLYATLLIVSFLLIISLGKTKMDWYDMPIYPFMALVVGGLLPALLNLTEKKEIVSSIKPPFLLNLFILLIFIYPHYRAMINEVYKPQEETYNEEYFLRDLAKGRIKADNYHVYYTGYAIQDFFYANIINDKGGKIDITQNPDFKKGDKILVSQKPCVDSLLAKYVCTPIDSNMQAKTYLVVGTK